MKHIKDENESSSSKVTLSLVLSIISLLLSIGTACFVVYLARTLITPVPDAPVQNEKTIGDEQEEDKEFNIDECVKLDIEALMNTYDENEIKATSDFCDKPVYVSGEVTNLSNYSIYVLTDSIQKGKESSLAEAQEYFKDDDYLKRTYYYSIHGEPNDEIKDSLMKFKVGDKITLYGELTYISYTDAEMNIHAVK